MIAASIPRINLHHSSTSMSDDCPADLNFEWLFDSERQDHLPMEEQLKLYKRHDLLPGKLYRTAAKIWGPAASRVRWIDCHSGLRLDRNIRGQGSCFSDAQSNGQDDLYRDNFNRNSSDRFLQSTNQTKLFGREDDTTVTAIDSNNLDSLRAWLDDRRKLRKNLDSIGLNDENWLRDKPNKTAMERRVLAKLIAKRSPPASQELTTTQNDTSKDLIGTKSLPALKRPSPEAIRIIERLLYERQMRLIDLFRIIDKDNNWRLTREEFRRAVHACRLPLEDKHIDELISMFGQSPTFELDYRDMALSMNVWKHEKIETKKKKVNSAGAIVQTDELRKKTVSDKIDGCHDNVAEDARGKLSNVEGTRRARTSNGCRLDAENLSSNEGDVDGNNNEKVPPADNGSTTAVQHRIEHNTQDYKGSVRWQNPNPLTTDAVMDIVRSGDIVRTGDIVRNGDIVHTGDISYAGVPTGDKAIDDHCCPSTLGGSTGEDVNRFRQDTLKEYLEIGRLCSENGLSFSVPVLQKALLYYADKQRAQMLEELRRSTNSHRREKSQNSRRPNARLAPIDLKQSNSISKKQSEINSGGQGGTHAVINLGGPGDTHAAGAVPGSTVLPSGLDKLQLRSHGNLSTNEGHKNVSTNNVSANNGFVTNRIGNTALLYAARNRDESRVRFNVNSEGNYTKRTPRPREGVEPKVDCWMTFEEYSKFRSGEEQTKRRRARAAVSPGRSGNMLDKMRLWMPHKDDESDGNALFQRISRRQGAPRYQCYGGGLAAWQINQSGYVQYGTIEK